MSDVIEFDKELKKKFDEWAETDEEMKQLCSNGVFEGFAYLAFIEGIRVGNLDRQHA